MKLLNDLPKDKYNDVQYVLEYLRYNQTIGNEDVEPIEYFHCFWKGKLTDLHLMCLSSLFATHPNSRVILWTSNAFETQGSHVWAKIKKAFKDKIGVLEVSKDHLKQANMERFYTTYSLLITTKNLDPSYNHNLAYASDIVRFMALYTYGGVWFDMDVLFLRNLDSIKLNRYISQWGADMCGNGAILRLEKGHDMVEKITHINPHLPFYPFAPGRPEDSSFMLENNLDLTILPSTFFDILWRPKNEIPDCLQFKTFEDFFKQEELKLPKEIYAYHWHNNWTMPSPVFFMNK